MATKINAGTACLNIDQVGSGFPVIIFLHGITANRRVWDPVVDSLSHQFTCVTVDQRGHGLSDRPPTGYGAAEYSDDILHIARQLSPAAGLYLVGHSLGARNAIVAAWKSPAVIRGVVALDFVPFIEPEVFDSLESRVLEGDRTFSSRAEIHEYLQGRYLNLPPDAISRRAEFGYAEERPGVFVPLADARAMAETVRGLREDLEPFLAGVTVPTVIVRGEQSLLVSPEAFGKAQELNPRVASAVIPGVDHYIPEEAPEAIGQLIESFATNRPLAPPLI